MTMKVEQELIHFGKHFLPIDTARKFWVLEHIGMRGPGIQVEHVSHDDPDKQFTYQIYTKTIENAHKLGMELLVHTNANLCAGFKDIKAQFIIDDGIYFPLIELQFWTEVEKQTFLALLAPTMFHTKRFSAKEGASKIRFIGRHGGKKERQIDRMRAIFGQICHLTADREFESLMNQKIKGRSIQLPTNDRNPNSPNFLVTFDRLYEISFSKGIRKETPLFNASLPFKCAGEKKS